jgi:hypothetical protein
MIMGGSVLERERAARSGEERGTALLGDAAVLIWNDLEAEGREEFYRWHDKEHVPERLALPGFRRGRRFVRPGHSPEWFTMYEATDVSALVSPQYLARLNAPTPATVSALRHFRNTSRAVCRLVHSFGASTGGQLLAMRLRVPADRSDDMCCDLRVRAFPRAMALTGVVACHLYAADESASSVRTAESSTRAFDVPTWVVLCEATRPEAANAAAAFIDSAEFRKLGVEVRSDAAVYALEISRLAVPRGG